MPTSIFLKKMQLHYNTLTLQEATAIQAEMKAKLNLAPLDRPIATIAGADISFNKYATTVYAGIVLLSFPDLLPLSVSLVQAEVTFPYVPGYLAFREVPALLKAWEALPQKPDVLVVDGHGIAHPRRTGIATHFGILTGQASLGCAKNILCGKYDLPQEQKGSSTPIRDKGEQIGWAFRSKDKVQPVFISPGHHISMEQSLHIIQQCTGKYRLPEPTRWAHHFVNEFRVGNRNVGYHLLTRDRNLTLFS